MVKRLLRKTLIVISVFCMLLGNARVFAEETCVLWIKDSYENSLYTYRMWKGEQVKMPELESQYYPRILGYADEKGSDHVDYVIGQKYQFYESTTIYAVYDASAQTMYHVTYHGIDGTVIKERDDAYGINYRLDRNEIPKVAGKSFAYWSDEPNGVEFYDDITHDMDLYAKYVDAVKIDFYADEVLVDTFEDGSIYNWYSYNYPEKEGYAFVYWSDRENGEYFDSSTLNGDTVLYAVYKPAYTVRYFADGELVHTRYNLYSWDYSDWTDVPEKEGYAFGYWSDEEGGEEFYGDLEENMDLYAVYLPTYTVNYFVDGELYVTKTDVTEYTYSSFRNVPKKAGKVFSYWSETENGMQYYGEIKNNLNLHAVYQDSFTVKYYVNGELYAKRSDRTQENYQWVGVQEPDHKAFLYWSESENGPRFSGQLYDNIELHAVLADAYAVNYYDENGKLWQRDTHVLPDNFLERSGPTSKNGGFSHWSLTKGGEPYTGEISENMDLYAVYAPFLTVTFYNEDGTEILHIRNDAYGYDWRWSKAPKYVNGKKFIYWSKTINGSEFWGEIKEDTILYAVYQQMYTVHYYVDGQEYGTWDEATQYDWYYPNTPQKAGYRFAYWTTDPETEIHFNGYGMTDGMNLYAIFYKTYTVEYYVDDELYAIWDQATERDYYYYPTPEKEGYRFVWWSETPDGEYYYGNDISDGTKLYAVFKKTYTVNYYVDGVLYATSDKANEVNWEYYPQPEIEGYKLAWWSKDPDGDYFNGENMYDGMNLYAVFRKTYTVNYYVDGTLYGVKDDATETNWYFYPEPYKTGYRFAWWSTDPDGDYFTGEGITDDMDLHAVFFKSFTINFWIDDEIKYVMTDAFCRNYWWHEVPHQLPDGRVFSHFETLDGGRWPVDFGDDPEEVYNVRAIYNQPYTVNYYVDGEIVHTRYDASANDYYWEAPVKEGYRFQYWGDIEGRYVDSIEGNTDLYAQYEKAYVVYYNDGSTRLHTRTDAVSWDYRWEDVPKEKDGLVFSYWSETEDGEYEFYGGDLYDGIILYAIYEEPLTIEYYIDDQYAGTRTDATSHDFDWDTEYRPGYIFYGWLDEEGNGVGSNEIHNNMKLYGYYYKRYTVFYYDSDHETRIGVRDDVTERDYGWWDSWYNGKQIDHWEDENGVYFDGTYLVNGMQVYAVYKEYFTLYYYDSDHETMIGSRDDATRNDFQWWNEYYNNKHIAYWVDEDCNTVTGDILVNDMHLYAVYDNVYTINYYDDDHTTKIGTRDDVTENDYYWNGEMPAKEGYVFVYWEDEDGYQLYSDNIVNGMNVYAHYEEALTIHYYVDGEEFGERTDASRSDYLWNGDQPYKEGYVFTGWQTENGEWLASWNVYDDMGAYAVFEEAFTINYYDMDHSTLIGVRTNATRGDYWYDGDDMPYYSGFRFDHWEDEQGVQLTGDTIVNGMNAYAVYVRVYMVNYYVDGERWTILEVTPDTCNTVKAPDKDGLAFIGWFTEEGEELGPDTIETGMNVYARYVTAYRITYIVYGEEVDWRYDCHDYDFDSPYIYNHNLEDVFQYWSLEENGEPFNGPVTENLTLYAVILNKYQEIWGVFIQGYDYQPDCSCLQVSYPAESSYSNSNSYGYYCFKSAWIPENSVQTVQLLTIPDGYNFIGFYKVHRDTLQNTLVKDTLITTEDHIEIEPAAGDNMYCYFAVFEKQTTTFYYSHPASYVGYVDKVDSADIDYGNYYACSCTSEDYLELTAHAYSSYEFRGWYLCDEYTEHPEETGTLLTDGETFIFTAYDDRLPNKYVLAYFERIVPFVQQINIPERLDLQVGGYETITATVSPEGAPDGFSWTSSDENIVVAVDVGSNLGRIAALSTGVATVTVTATDGSNVSATCIVYVHNYEFVGFRFNSDDTADAVFMDYMDGTEVSVPAEVSVGITSPSCTETGVKSVVARIYASDSLDNDYHEAINNTVIPATGHESGEVQYQWRNNYQNCYAYAVCNNCGEEISEDVRTTVSEDTATCTEEGTATYTATFTNELFQQQTITAVSPAKGHSLVYVPDRLPSCEDDGYNQHYRCTRCGKLFDDDQAEHEISIDDVTEPALGHQPMAAVKDEDSQTAPDCDHDGGYDMVVYCANCYAEMSREHVVLPALGHDWVLTYYWNTEDFSTVYGIARCSRCHTEIVSETVTPTSEIIKAATCMESGEIKYSAVFDDSVFTPVSITQDLAPLGHSWSEPTYSWNDDFSKVTATRECRNGNHPETETVSATGMETVAPGCEEEGEMTYTSQNFTNEAFTAQTTTQPIAALGHDWGKVTYTWGDGNESCTASRECNRDHSHVEQETATATITAVDPTCTEKGSNTYTVVFTNSAFKEQVRVVDVAALGHEEATRKENEVAATCTEAGSYDEVVYCSRCGVELSRTARTVDALGHDFGEWKQTKAPTCEETGTEQRECSRCDVKETRTVDALGHDWGEVTYSWFDNNESCEALRVCKRDSSHYENEGAVVTKVVTEPTCLENGKIVYTATFKNPAFETQTKTVKLEAPGHNMGDPVKENEKEATCTEDGGYDLVIYCTACGKELSRTHKTTTPALGHNWGDWKQTKAPTCEEKGTEERECSICGEKETRDVDALGHKYGDWKYDGESAKTHTHICANDSNHKETEPCTFDEGTTVDGVTTYTCKVCGGTYSVKEEGPVKPVVSGITRVYGSNRFGTSFAISEAILKNAGKDKHDTVILANGDNFADALAGSYLAAVKNAPIIITRNTKVSEVNAYIKSVLNKGGTIYVLGGTAAVPESSLAELSRYEIKRLAGNNRYGTNLEILKEAGVDGDTILIATGINYADSLSASATGLPMLLVKGQDTLNDDQIKFLKSNPNKKLIILGGESAVSSNFERELKKYGEVSRIAGDNRFATSIKIAKYFFAEADTAVLAYGSDFPDGLCGGPLAYQVGAPLILTRNDKTDIARPYTKERNITDGYALGGTSVLPDATVRKLFGAENNVPINKIER